MGLELSSRAFEAGDRLPERYTCEAQNVSPPLQWRGAPSGTQSLVLICDDPDAPGGTFAHWVLYGIPADRTELEEAVPAESRLEWGARHGRNDFGKTAFGGPCPPRGSEHRYYFRLYALDEAPDLPPGATRQQVLDRIEPHVLDSSELVARYARAAGT